METVQLHLAHQVIPDLCEDDHSSAPSIPDPRLVGRSGRLDTVSLSPEVRGLADELSAIRRDLHQEPELAFEETRTAGIVAERLRALGYRVTTGVAKTGVVGVLEGNASAPPGARPRKTVLVRADMDALPIQEENEVPYKSRRPGVMHACGHDGHTAILLGVAEVLAKRKDQLPGNVKLVFQPAEEGPGGAKPMIEAGVMENPKVDTAIGLHLANGIPVGVVGLQAGPVMSLAEHFSLQVKGRGGHAAYPHRTIDPIVMAGDVVGSAQAVISREKNTLDPGVLSFGTIRGGTKSNIIPNAVELTGTVRTYSPAVRDLIKTSFERRVRGVTDGANGSYQLDWTPGYPAVVNDPAVTEVVRQVTSTVLGPAGRIIPLQLMGSDDMAYFLRNAPGCYLFLGSAPPDKAPGPPHHSSTFDFDEDVMPVGVEILARSVERLLGS